MKKITKIFVLAIASMVALASCQKVNDVEATFQPKVLKAVFEDELSKTVLSENFQIQWSATDAITGFDLDCKNYTSTATSVSQDKLEATFTFGGVSLENDLTLAMYPADSQATISEGEVITTTLPLVQNAVAGSFDPKANLALANGGEERVKFFNAGGLLAFDIKNDNITKIEIEAGSYENFAGPANLNFAEGAPLLQSTYESDLHKVTLQGEFVNGKTYYAVVIPGDYSSLKMVFTRNDGKTATFTNSKTLTVLRNGVVTVWKNAIDDSKWQGGSGSDSETYKFEPFTSAQDVTFEATNFSIAFHKNTGSTNPQWNGTYKEARVYAKGSVVVSSEKTIAKIEYAYTINANNKGNAPTIDSVEGSTDKGTWDANAKTWTGSDSEVTLSTSGSAGNLGFTSITVYFGEDPVVTKYNVNIADGITGGTVTATPAKAEAGATVTLTATPATGYEFESWNVTGATVADATSATTTFTMPAADVTVSATFKAEAIPDKTIAEFIAAKGVKCYLTGVVSNIVNTTYGNFDLTDDSGEIYIYGCLTSEGVARQFSTLGIEEGDRIKVLASEYEHYNDETHEAKNVVFVDIVKKAPYLNVTASKTTGIAAAGETIAVTVNTNIEGWTVSSNNAAFAISDKTATSFKVVVSENTSTTDGRTAKITVSADGVNPVEITLTQSKASGGAPKTYTAEIVQSTLKINDNTQSSTYNKYKGKQSVVAKADDNSEITVEFEIVDVMPNSGIQFKASAGTMTGSDWGTITSIDAGNKDLTVSINGGSFSIKKTNKGAAVTQKITIVFTK